MCVRNMLGKIVQHHEDDKYSHIGVARQKLAPQNRPGGIFRALGFNFYGLAGLKWEITIFHGRNHGRLKFDIGKP
jgi:hypothetical protein